MAHGGCATDATGGPDGPHRRRRRGAGRRRTGVHHRDLGYRALLAVLRGGPARHRPGPHAAGALARTARDDPRACHWALGGGSHDQGAGSDRRSHVGDSRAPGRHPGAAPVRARQRLRGTCGGALPAVRRAQSERDPAQGWSPARLHDAHDRRGPADRLAGERAGHCRRDDGGCVRGLPRALLEIRQPRPSDPPAGELPAERRRRVCAVAAAPRSRLGRRGRAAARLIPCRASGGCRASNCPRADATHGPCRPLAARRHLSVPRRPDAGAARPESRRSRRRADRRHGPGGLWQERADQGDPRHLSAGVRRGPHRRPAAGGITRW